MTGVGSSTRIDAMVVDDEPLARSSIVTLLKRDPQIGTIVECGSGQEALEQIKLQKPDLLYLDIQMPECDGFDVIEMLAGDVPRAIVFVTAFDEYALRAFEAGVLDYLLKPFDDARFDLALSRAKERLALASQNGSAALERLVVKSAGQVWFIKPDDIDWVEAADYYSCVHVGNKNHVLRRSMSDLEAALGPTDFCRIHRSTIVNLNRVAGIESDSGGEYQVILHGGVRLKLSRRYRKDLQARMHAIKT